MSESNFPKTPPTEEEWPPFWQAKNEWEDCRPFLMPIATVLKSAPILKRAFPYLAGLAFVLALATHWREATVAFLKAIGG